MSEQDERIAEIRQRLEKLPQLIKLTQWERDCQFLYEHFALEVVARTVADRKLEVADARVQALEVEKDGAYSERDQLVAALSKCFPSWLGYHAGGEWDEDWRNIVFVELPTGQASWHIHDSELPLFAHLKPGGAGCIWDGHDTPEKYRRLAALVAEARRETSGTTWCEGC